jgi:hypothetical protein
LYAILRDVIAILTRIYERGNNEDEHRHGYNSTNHPEPKTVLENLAAFGRGRVKHEFDRNGQPLNIDLKRKLRMRQRRFNKVKSGLNNLLKLK